MDQQTDQSATLQDTKQQKSTIDPDSPFRLAPVRVPRAVDWGRSPRSLRLPRMTPRPSRGLFSVHGNGPNMSGLGDNSETLSGLESCKIKTRTDGTHPGSHKATELSHSGSNDYHNEETQHAIVLQHEEEELPKNSSEGIGYPTRLCDTCKKQKDPKEFHDRRYRNIKYTKNCLECREEDRSKNRKRPKRRSGRGKLGEEKEKGTETPKASAKQAHDEGDSGVEPEARDDTTGDSKTESNVSVAPSQKRRLPTGFDDQGPKKHAKSSEISRTGEQLKTGTKPPKASEPPKPSEQPAMEEESEELGAPENQSLALEAKESEQPKAVEQIEPAEWKVASPATVDQHPTEPGQTQEKAGSHDAVDTGHEAEPLHLRSSDGPDSTQTSASLLPSPSLSPWSVAYDGAMPFTEAEFERGRAYLLQGTPTAAAATSPVGPVPPPAAGPEEERLTGAQRCLVHYLGAALPELRDRLRSAPWCLRARRWLQYAGDLERVALDRARAEHPLLALVVGDVARRRRFRAALGQVVLDQADRDGLVG